MTIASSSVEGIQRAASLLDYAGKRIARTDGTIEDVVSLSDAAVALIQARIDVAANVSAIHTADEIQKTLLDLIA